MGNIQLTKKEAIQRIDEILVDKFEKCVKATCNHILEIAHDNYEAKRKKISGRIFVGLDFFNPNDCTVNFNFNKEEIINLWAAAPGRNDLTTIERFTKKFDLFAMDYENIQNFSFRFFDGWFGFPTKTFKQFQNRLKEILSHYGIKISCGKAWVTSVIKVSYRCNLQKDFKPEQDGDYSNDDTGFNDVQNFIKEIFADTFENNVGEYSYDTTENSLFCNYKVKLPNFGNRQIWFGVMILLEKQIVAISATLGRIPQNKVLQAKMYAEQYDAVEANRFKTDLTQPCDGYDGQLILSSYWEFKDAEFLAKVIQVAIPAIAEQCNTSNLTPFVNVTYEMN